MDEHTGTSGSKPHRTRRYGGKRRPRTPRRAAVLAGCLALILCASRGSDALALLGESDPPRLVSIARQDPASEYTNANTIVFRATFSEAVQFVTAEDFRVSGATAAIAEAAELADTALLLLNAERSVPLREPIPKLLEAVVTNVSGAVIRHVEIGTGIDRAVARDAPYRRPQPAVLVVNAVEKERAVVHAHAIDLGASAPHRFRHRYVRGCVILKELIPASDEIYHTL